MREDRGPWYLLTGLVLGLAFGLVYAWVIAPVQYVDTTPASLRADFKEQYRALIAVAYLSNGELDRAKARLKLLNDIDPGQQLAVQAQLAQTSGAPESEVRGLALLAVSYNPQFTLPSPVESTPASPTVAPSSTLSPTPVIVLTATATLMPETPQITHTITVTLSGPRSTVTPLPSLTPSPTPGAPFVIEDQTLICEPKPSQPLIEVETLDAAGQPVPGVEIIVSWDKGEDHFFTGLKPEVSPGYADFTMTPGVKYILQLADGGEAIPDLTPTECEASDGSRFWGSWKLTFVQR